MRNANWELDGLKFLSKINSNRYCLKTESFLEGMFIEFYLIDNLSNCQIGRRIVMNSLSKECWFKSSNHYI